jgi:hypothetical protein
MNPRDPWKRYTAPLPANDVWHDKREHNGWWKGSEVPGSGSS